MEPQGVIVWEGSQISKWTKEKGDKTSLFNLLEKANKYVFLTNMLRIQIRQMFWSFIQSFANLSTWDVLIMLESLEIANAHILTVIKRDGKEMIKAMWLTSDTCLLVWYLILEGNIIFSECEDNVIGLGQSIDKSKLNGNYGLKEQKLRVKDERGWVVPMPQVCVFELLVGQLLGVVARAIWGELWSWERWHAWESAWMGGLF